MKKDELTYTKAVQEIEQIVKNLEDNELNIDELSSNVKRVSVLIAYCKEKLHTTEDEIEKILKGINE